MVPTTRLRLCYLGCRYHLPTDKRGNLKPRPCPAKMLVYQIRKAGYEASQHRGMVKTNCPREALDPLFEKVIRRTHSERR